MNYSGLALDQAPPLSVPLRFFLTAPLFAIAAALLLLWGGPAAFASRWTTATLAATHLMTLGFLSMIMFGAVLQLLPVLAGSPVPRPRLVSGLLHVLLTAGALALSAGLFSERPGLMKFATVLLALAFTAFIVVTAYSLYRSRSAHASVRTMGLAVVALTVAAGLGLYLAAGYGWGAGPSRGVTDTHLTWALLGWVGLLVVGVAYQVVPMFQMTPEYPAPLLRWLGRMTFALLVVWSGGQAVLARLAVDPMIPVMLTGALLGAAFGLFAVATLRLQHRRRRRVPDVTLAFWRVGMASLLAAIAAWVLAQIAPGLAERLQYGLVLGMLMIFGFAFSVINGMLYKIVPFLIWLHLNARRFAAGKAGGRVPNMKEVIPEPRMRLQFRTQMLALALLCTTPWWPEVLIYPAALALTVSCGMLWINLYWAARVYSNYSRESPVPSL